MKDALSARPGFVPHAIGLHPQDDRGVGVGIDRTLRRVSILLRSSGDSILSSHALVYVVWKSKMG